MIAYQTFDVTDTGLRDDFGDVKCLRVFADGPADANAIISVRLNTNHGEFAVSEICPIEFFYGVSILRINRIETLNAGAGTNVFVTVGMGT